MRRFALKLKKSGYSARTRAELIKSTILSSREMRREEDEGPPRERQEDERAMKKAIRMSSWVKVGKTAGDVARAPLIISPAAVLAVLRR